MPKAPLDLSLPTVRLAGYWIRLSDGRIKCQLCQRACTLRSNQQGMCRNRVRKDDQLYVITYGNLSILELKPIENTPFYHFYPGSLSLAVGSWFCNLACIWCQNHEITRSDPPMNQDDIFYVGKKALMRQAKIKGATGILFSYNEPSVSLFEYSRDVIPLAKKEGLYTGYVTNGYFSLDALEELVELGLDAVHVDLKGCAPKINPYMGGKMEVIWAFLRKAWDLDLHIEISTLVIPEITDSPRCITDIARRVSRELDASIPLHVLKYYPFFRAELFGVTAVPSDEIILRQAALAREYLNYVYVGNIEQRTIYDDTRCPRCDAIVIQRNKITVTKNFLTRDHSCPNCGEKIPITGNITARDQSFLYSIAISDHASREDEYWVMKTRSPKRNLVDSKKEEQHS